MYRVVLGLCLRATKITATAILPYQGTQKEKAGEEIRGLCCFIQNYVRVSLGCKACSCFCFSACFTHLGWEEWRLVWEMGVPICCSCHKDWREGLGNTFLLKCSFKKISKRDHEKRPSSAASLFFSMLCEILLRASQFQPLPDRPHSPTAFSSERDQLGKKSLAYCCSGLNKNSPHLAHRFECLVIMTLLKRD